VVALLITICCWQPITLIAQDTPADNWAQFRGNHRLTGVSESTVPNEPKLLWTYEAGESIESSAAIVGGTVFVGSQKGELVALNLENGAVYWKYQTGAPIGESSPAYSNGMVFIGDLGSVLHAVNASDGRRVWTFKAGSEIKSSPVVVGDRVLIGSYDEHLYCISMRNGSVIWKLKTTPRRVSQAVSLLLPVAMSSFAASAFPTATRCLMSRRALIPVLRRPSVASPPTTEHSITKY
jgi:outer membrane protein assembly factor BamB